MKYKLCLLALLWPVVTCFSQSSPLANSLKVGDKLPDVEINLLNSPVLKSSLSCYKGKLIILDFWSTWCGACIAQFPNLHKLQHQFQDNITILAVTYQDSATVSRLFKKIKYLEGVQLPIAINDTLLWNLFHPPSLPHEVWISAEGRVISITSSEYVTAANIQRVLNGEQTTNWIQKKDDPDFDYNKPLLNKRSQLYYSHIAGHIDEAEKKGGYSVDSIKKTKRFYLVNYGLLHMYGLALSKGFILTQPNRVILEVADKSRYIYDGNSGYRQEWTSKNTYSYESISPVDITKKQLLHQLKSSLDSFLSVQSFIEERAVPCYRLEIQNKFRHLSAGGESLVELSDEYPVKRIKNATIDDLVKALNATAGIPLIINKTNITGNVDLELKLESLRNWEEVQRELGRNGFKLIPAKEKTEVFVIKEQSIVSKTKN